MSPATPSPYAFQGHHRILHPGSADPGAWYSFRCGSCGREVSGAVVAQDPQAPVLWLQCTNCCSGSVLSFGRFVPATEPGEPVQGLPDDVDEAWQEARQSLGAGAFAASQLVCRKVLMHVAVEKGAKTGLSFAEYIDFLAASGYVTPPMRPWVDFIRQAGNSATHELEPHDKDRALSTLAFTQQLLTLIYAMEHLTKTFVRSPEG
jgi:hypothetical protein